MEARFHIVLVLVTATCAILAAGQEVQTSEQVAVKWGVADGSATVGSVFRMHIPGDAFSGKVISYSVHGNDGTQLPCWLEFNGAENVLQGLPTPKDAGQLSLEVTAKGESSEASVDFTIFVRDKPSHGSGPSHSLKRTSGPEIVRCKREEPETVATMIVDSDLDTASPAERLALAQRFHTHMELQEDMIRLVPVGNSPLLDSNALVSGTGDCMKPKTQGLFISWTVGCGQVKDGHFPVLQRLDDDSSSGKMAKILGLPVIGWHVTNSHLQAPKRRKRRQAVATATPVMTPVMPTKTEGATDTMTREVVTMVSPTIQPTTTQTTMEKTDTPTPPVVTTTTTTTTEKVTPPVIKPDTTTLKKTTETEKPEEATTMPPVVDPDVCVKGQKPIVKNKIGRMRVNVGEIIEFVIPKDTFEDCEVGGTRGLSLQLYMDRTTELPSDLFLQFDKKMQKIIGLPMDKDAGTYSFNLVAMKQKVGLVANLEFIMAVRVSKGKKKKVNHELSVAVDYDYDKFMADVKTRAQLATNVASLYGDPDSSNLAITKMERGSVIYGWTNTSLGSAKGCPVKGISKLVGKLVNEDGSLSETAIEKMKPFVLLKAAAQPMGECEDVEGFPEVESKVRVPHDDTTTAVATDKPDEEEDGKDGTLVDESDDGDDDDKTKATDKPMDEETTTDDVAKGSATGGDGSNVLINTVVPAVIIVAVLLIALIIACVLYRRKRKGKMNVEEQNTFVNKGAPVIFPDELEDKPSDVNKPLLVEGSPAPPPEYHRGASESPDPDAPNSYRNGPNGTTIPTDDGITEMPERLYDPPPPVTASSNNKQPRPTQQQPFSQPPQILP